MQVSVLELLKGGDDLALASSETIHYPTDGHVRLSSVEAGHFWFTERRSLVHRLLLRFGCGGRKGTPTPAPFGIDLGCGSGYTAVWLTEKGIPTYGQDLYRGFHEYQKQGRGVGFLQGDLSCVEPSAEFDFALLLDVIEHIPDDTAFLDHVGKLLKPGGILVVSAPAFAWLWSKVDDRSGHLRRYVKSDFLAFERLPNTRYKIEFSSYFYGSTLPMYLVSRMVTRWQGDSESASASSELAPPAFLNSALKWLLRAEREVALRAGIPVGSSLFVVLRKAATL